MTKKILCQKYNTLKITDGISDTNSLLFDLYKLLLPKLQLNLFLEPTSTQQCG